MSSMIETVLGRLVDRQLVVGEIVQAGWLAFRVVSAGPPAELEAPDFERVGGFTRDLRVAEAVFWLQANTLRDHAASARDCSMRQTAVVSRSFVPGHPDAFLSRGEPTNEWDSGWYVGMTADTLDMADAGSFTTLSLYELSVADRRTLAWWLMPVGSVVDLDKGPVPM